MMHWILAEFLQLRTADHVDDRRRQRSKIHKRELDKIRKWLHNVNTFKGIHRFLPPEMWIGLSDGSTATISNKWDSKRNQVQLYLATILDSGKTPGGVELTKHLLHRALDRSQERRAGRLWDLVNRVQRLRVSLS